MELKVRVLTGIFLPSAPNCSSFLQTQWPALPVQHRVPPAGWSDWEMNAMGFLSTLFSYSFPFFSLPFLFSFFFFSPSSVIHWVRRKKIRSRVEAVPVGFRQRPVLGHKHMLVQSSLQVPKLVQFAEGRPPGGTRRDCRFLSLGFPKQLFKEQEKPGA